MPSPPLTLPGVKELFPEHLFEAAQFARRDNEIKREQTLDHHAFNDRSPSTQIAVRHSNGRLNLEDSWTNKAYQPAIGEPSFRPSSIAELQYEQNERAISSPRSDNSSRPSFIPPNYTQDSDFYGRGAQSAASNQINQINAGSPSATVWQGDNPAQPAPSVFQFHPIYYDGTEESLRGRGRVPHMPVYREEKRHICPHCDKRFNRPSSLKIHVNTHTGDKPFECPFPGCGRQFNVSSNMRRHYQNHGSSNNATATSPSGSTSPTSPYASQASDHRHPRHATSSGSTRRGSGRFIHHSHSTSLSSEASTSWTSESDMESFEGSISLAPRYESYDGEDTQRANHPDTSSSSGSQFRYTHVWSNTRTESTSPHDSRPSLASQQTVFSATPMYTYPPPPAPSSFSALPRRGMMDDRDSYSK